MAPGVEIGAIEAPGKTRSEAVVAVNGVPVDVNVDGTPFGITSFWRMAQILKMQRRPCSWSRLRQDYASAFVHSDGLEVFAPEVVRIGEHPGSTRCRESAVHRSVISTHPPADRMRARWYLFIQDYGTISR